MLSMEKRQLDWITTCLNIFLTASNVSLNFQINFEKPNIYEAQFSKKIYSYLDHRIQFVFFPSKSKLSQATCKLSKNISHSSNRACNYIRPFSSAGCLFLPFSRNMFTAYFVSGVIPGTH